MATITAPLSVCWDITSHCNDSCAFCYRVTSQSDAAPHHQATILNKLIGAGVKKISFVGGEPLLLKHLPRLLDRAQTSGVLTSVVSNGFLLRRRWTELESLLDWLTLPLDATTPESQRAMSRAPDHFERVQTLLDWLTKSNLSLKINTVVSAINADELPLLACLLRRYRISRWKLFHFYPVRGAALRAQGVFSISHEAFLAAISRVWPLVPQSCSVTVASHDYLQRNYFSISPDGSVRTSIGEQDLTVGNLLADTVEDIWAHSAFDKKKHVLSRQWLLAAPSLGRPGNVEIGVS